MSSVIDSIERRQQRKGIPSFVAGDRVRVHFKVIEGSRERTQVFEGIVLKRQGSGARETFTVRKQSFGVGVERTFPLHSPKIEKLEIAARGDVRRAKLYYLRGRIGKAARVAERRWGIDEELISTPVSSESEEPQAVDAEGVSQAEEDATQAEEVQDETGQAAGPVGAGDPPPPAVAEASSGEVPPTPPPAAEASATDTEASETEDDAETPAGKAEGSEAGETEDTAAEAESKPDAEDPA
jgi:large subunit ribosomal protein L19